MSEVAVASLPCSRPRRPKTKMRPKRRLRKANRHRSVGGEERLHIARTQLTLDPHVQSVLISMLP